MNWDPEKIDEAALGLLYHTLHDGNRAWKSLDWDAMERLHQKGWIENPASRAKSVVLTSEGLKAAERSAKTHLCEQPPLAWSSLRRHPETEYCPANGLRGILCRSAADGKMFFRVYEESGEFTDYDVCHDELAVTIDKDEMASLYRTGDQRWLDHSPQVLGLDDQQ